MATYAVGMEIKRRYIIYVDDPKGNMTHDEIADEAIRKAVEDEGELAEMYDGINPEDICYSRYEYTL